MSRVFCPAHIVSETINYLQKAGNEQCECIVLWLGRRTNGVIEVAEAYRPEQVAQSHRFYIPPETMAALKAHLRTNRLMIAAQVHSHPEESFHSYADDVGAIVRHVGALSFVLPWFADGVTCETFLVDAALFDLQADNEWREVAPEQVGEKCQIV